MAEKIYAELTEKYGTFSIRRSRIIRNLLIDNYPDMDRDYRNRIFEYIRMNLLLLDCESFFRSDWYTVLCDIDGEDVMQMIRKKVEESADI